MVPNVTGFFLHKRMEQRENSGQQEQQLEGISVLLAFVIGRQWLHCTVCYHHITINFPLPSFKKGYIISIFSHLEPQRMSLSSPPLQPTQSIHLSHNVSLFLRSICTTHFFPVEIQMATYFLHSSVRIDFVGYWTRLFSILSFGVQQ